MDLEKLVENRIAELQAQAAVDTHEEYPPAAQSFSAEKIETLIPPEEDFRDRRIRRTNTKKDNNERFDSDKNVARFCETVDAALVEVVSRVMEIAERVTEDHTRLEKELLDLRLETLESAESVMDMALNIRKKARQFLINPDDAEIAASGLIGREFAVKYEQVDSAPSDVPDDGRAGLGTRASMHDLGVAALFKKTH